MRKLLLLLSIFFIALPSLAQIVAPFQGVGNVQFFDNNGNILTSGVLYAYFAGTSTQQATYTDSTGTIQNPNPITFTTGARASIWTTVGSYYKFVLCMQNDGAFCAAGDILFSVDNVPGGATSGSSGGSPFIGIFISSTSSPATSGILRLASGDSICWRNSSGSTNLCFSKDSSDVLTWAGGSLKLPAVTAPTAQGGYGILWADTNGGSERLKMSNNNSAPFFIPGIASAGTPGDFVTLAANGIDLQDSGSATPGFKVECVNITAVTVSNTTSLTPLQGCTIPANDIGASQTFEIDVQGVGSTVATPTLIIGVYLDGVLIADTTPLTGNRNWSNTLWTCHAFFTGLTTGSGGTVSPALQTWFDTGTGITIPSGTPNSPVTINTTSSHVLQFQATWGIASASDTVTSSTMTVYRIN